jgi:hypothetical protein
LKGLELENANLTVRMSQSQRHVDQRLAEIGKGDWHSQFFKNSTEVQKINLYIYTFFLQVNAKSTELHAFLLLNWFSFCFIL